MTVIISAELERSLKKLDADEPEPEKTPEEAMRQKIRQELLSELHQRLVVSPTEPPPKQAQFVRQPDAGLDAFFTLAAQQKQERRRNRGH
jgi:hypothetical protein